MDSRTAQQATAAGRSDPPGRGQRIARGVGELLITLGLVVLLFVFYQVYVTGWFSAQKQNEAEDRLEESWRNDRGGLVPVDGAGMARLYIPALGADYRFVVVEGTSQANLEIGPGHYTDSALPGGRGNFAVAGHRVGKGAPFNEIDLIRPCDALVVETGAHWFVYRMLPTAGEPFRPADRRCAGVGRLGETVAPDYAETVGREVVLPHQGEVIAPVPHRPDTRLRTQQRVPLITLTTCNPKFSDAQRLIVHGVLVREWAKDPDQPDRTPPELRETT